MKTVALGEVVECLDRLRRPVKESERVAGDVPYYGANGQMGWIDRPIFDEPLVIVAEDGGHFQDPERGVAYRISGPTWVNNHGHVLRSTQRVDRDYLFHALRNYEFGPYISGSTRSKLTQKQLLQAEIPLPSLDEQRRIAAILDHADALRAKRHQILAHLDDLTQSIFHDMFEGVEATGTVGDVAEVQGGLQVSAKRASLPVEVPYLRVANAHRGRLDLSEVKTLRATKVEVERTRLVAGDLLFVEGHADPREVGRVALWSGQVQGCVHQNHLIRGRLDHERVLPAYAATWLNTDRGAAHFRRAGRTTSGLNTISASTVRSAPLPLPPLHRQREFVSNAKVVDVQRVAVQRAIEASNELFASLQFRAFRGEL